MVDIQNNEQPRRWRRGCVSLVGTMLLLFVMACSGTILAVWHGGLAPNWFDWQLGLVRLVGFTTWNANCPPFIGCDPTREESYVIWLVVDHVNDDRVNRQWFRLFRLPIEHDVPE